MGIVRMSRTAIRRFVIGLKRQEATPSARQGPVYPPAYTPYPDQEAAFELTEEIPAVHTAADKYDALIRDWDPSASGGEGAYVTGATAIVVRDLREVGYYGASGHVGACKLRFTSTGTMFGEIIDMECP